MSAKCVAIFLKASKEHAWVNFGAAADQDGNNIVLESSKIWINICHFRINPVSFHAAVILQNTSAATLRVTSIENRASHCSLARDELVELELEFWLVDLGGDLTFQLQIVKRIQPEPYSRCDAIISNGTQRTQHDGQQQWQQLRKTTSKQNKGDMRRQRVCFELEKPISHSKYVSSDGRVPLQPSVAPRVKAPVMHDLKPRRVIDFKSRAISRHELDSGDLPRTLGNRRSKEGSLGVEEQSLIFCSTSSRVFRVRQRSKVYAVKQLKIKNAEIWKHEKEMSALLINVSYRFRSLPPSNGDIEACGRLH